MAAPEVMTGWYMEYCGVQLGHVYLAMAKHLDLQATGRGTVSQMRT